MSSYPGGKSGAGIYQRLINLIPRHGILVVPFAGHCGVVRNIRPAEHTIVIDRDPAVCQWWADWSITKHGRAIEIHNCDGIEWLRYQFGVTEYSAVPGVPGSGVTGRNRRPVMESDMGNPITQVLAAKKSGTAATPKTVAEAFIFADPPYVMSERSTGKIYQCELSDEDHQRFLGTVTQIDAAKYSVMICGYSCDLYSPLDSWFSIDHRVPTRGGLQDERIWMNYRKPVELHDYAYIGDGRRSRERIRRRQKNWREQLQKMPEQERLAMLEVLNSIRKQS